MKGLLLLGLCLALTACPSASGDNGPPRGVTASVLQVGDSVRIILQWTITPPGSRQLPLLRFDTRLRQGASTILASGTAPATGRADTVTIPAPPVGDTLADLRGEVRAVDTRLVSSGYVASPPFRVVITPLPPNPPDSVRADTLTVLGATGPAFGTVRVMPITSTRDINASSCGAATFAVLPDGDLAMQPDSVCGRAVLAGVCSGVPGVWGAAADAWPPAVPLGDFWYVFAGDSTSLIGRLRVTSNLEPTVRNSLMVITDNRCS